jgi:hypothetical protein
MIHYQIEKISSSTYRDFDHPTSPLIYSNPNETSQHIFLATLRRVKEEQKKMLPFLGLKFKDGKELTDLPSLIKVAQEIHLESELKLKTPEAEQRQKEVRSLVEARKEAMKKLEVLREKVDISEGVSKEFVDRKRKLEEGLIESQKEMSRISSEIVELERKKVLLQTELETKRKDDQKKKDEFKKNEKDYSDHRSKNVETQNRLKEAKLEFEKFEEKKRQLEATFTEEENELRNARLLAEVVDSAIRYLQETSGTKRQRLSSNHSSSSSSADTGGATTTTSTTSTPRLILPSAAVAGATGVTAGVTSTTPVEQRT